MKKLAPFILLLFCIAYQAYAQEKTVTYLYDAGAATALRSIDVKNLVADISIDPYGEKVTGNARFLFSPLSDHVDSINFWVPDIEFSRVEIPGFEILHEKTGENLVIRQAGKSAFKAGTDYTLVMEYIARPKYDLFFIGWNEPGVRENKNIWAHRPFHWLPFCHDRLTMTLNITFDKDYMVFSNGVRESVTDNEDGTRTWKYTMPSEHPFFSTALVIGDYRYLERRTSAGIPLELWYYTSQGDHAEPTYRYTEQMFDFFGDEFGMPYPYELYREAPVQDYLYGAMETTTSTVFGDYLAVDNRAFDLRNYVNVNAHELAHQWYGNCLSHLRPADVWLTESFATYYAKMFEKEVFGDDYYENVRRMEFEETLEASKNDGFGVGHSRGGRARWYPKGSLVLDMLRDVLGEEGFRASISHYTNKNAFSEVETGEFLTAIYEATGKPMEWFFDQWIYRGGEPKYEVSWRDDLSPEGKPQVVIAVKQVHQINELTGLFNMPINFEVHYLDGSSVKENHWIGEEFQEISIANREGKQVSFVLFDPGDRILKTTTFSKSAEELKQQAIHAPHMIDRYNALVALRDHPLEQKKETLQECWAKENFQLTRGEVLRQLLVMNTGEFDKIIMQALQDQDPLVRRAVLEHSAGVPVRLRGNYEALLTDPSYVNVEKVLDLLTRSFPENTLEYLASTEGEIGWRGMNIRMKWLEIAIEHGEEQKYIDELVEYCSPRHEFETRINAFQLLKRLGYIDMKSAGYLVDGYFYWNYKVSNAAKLVLSYFYQQNQGRVIIDRALDSSPWPTARENDLVNAIR